MHKALKNGMRTAIVGLTTLVLVALIAGCYLQDGTKGTLVVSLSPQLTERTIQPNFSMDVDRYVITLAREGGETIVEVLGADETTFVRTSLVPGTWTVTVDAYNDPTPDDDPDDPLADDGEIIGTDTTVVDIASGELVEIDLTVRPLSGLGTLDLAVTWPDVLTNAVVKASLVPAGLTNYDPDDYLISFAPPVYDPDTQIWTSSYNEQWQNGYYTLIIQLLDEGSTAVWGTVEAVRIIFDEISSKTYDLSVETNHGALRLTFDTQLNNPFEVGLALDNAGAIQETDTISATATATETVTGWSWYLQGAPLDGTITESVSESTATFGPLTPGYYWLNVVAENADGVLSSQTVDFQVVEATTVQ